MERTARERTTMERAMTGRATVDGAKKGTDEGSMGKMKGNGMGRERTARRTKVPGVHVGDWSCKNSARGSLASDGSCWKADTGRREATVKPKPKRTGVRRAAAVLLLCVSGAVPAGWALGQNEQESSGSLHAALEYAGGGRVLKVDLPGEGVERAGARVDGRLVGLDGTGDLAEYGRGADELVDELAAIAGAGDRARADLFDRRPFGDYRGARSSDGGTNEEAAALPQVAGLSGFTVRLDGGGPPDVMRREVELVLVDEDGSAELVAFTVAAEAFPGEYALLSEHAPEALESEEAYARAAVHLIAALVSESEQSVVGDAAGEVLGIELDWAPGAAFSGLDASERQALRGLLRERLSRVVAVGGEDRGGVRLPVSGAGPVGTALLSGGERDPYLGAYLALLYRLGKPLLSDVVAMVFAHGASGLPAEWLGREHESDWSDRAEEATRELLETQPYDYERYRPLSAAEGRALADAALRFYTGGVEYTPWRVEGSAAASDGSREIAGSTALRAVLEEWARPGSAESSLRVWNYEREWLPVLVDEEGEVRPVRPPHAVTVRDAGGPAVAVDLTAPEEGDGEVSLSGISLYTARNRAWSPGVVARGVWEVSDAAGEVVVDRDNEKLRGETTSLNDGAVAAGAGVSAEGAAGVVEEAGLLHLRRGEPFHTIRVGYEFAEPQRIGGVVLQLAASHVSRHNESGWFRENRPLSFEYRDAAGEWRELEGRTSEIAYRPPDGGDGGDRYAGDFADQGEEYPGFAVSGLRYAGGDAAQRRREVAFVFHGAPSAVHGLRLVDRTESAALTVGEMLVFDGDPVQHIGTAVSEARLGWNRAAVSEVYRRPELLDVVGALDEESLTAWEAGRIVIDAEAHEALRVGVLEDGRTIRLVMVPRATEDAPIEQVVVWGAEELGAPPEAAALGEQMARSAALRLGEGGADAVGARITTPFVEPGSGWFRSDRPVVGNPLPYVAGGADGPRSFAYKMLRQEEAMAAAYPLRYPFEGERTTRTTRAVDDAGYEGYLEYVDAAEAQAYFDGEADRYAPFLPGYVASSRAGRAPAGSVREPERLAGVDALGLVSGALAMAGYDAQLNAGEAPFAGELNELYGAVENVFGERPAALLDGYYRMDGSFGELVSETGAVPGLGADGAPAFGSERAELPLTRSGARFAASDLEAMSVVVPALHLIRPGDLLVGETAQGEYHVGVIVATVWDEAGAPAPGAEPAEWWNRVIVATTRRDLGAVRLASWGAPAGIDGGLGEAAERYHVRRLMRLRQDAADASEPRRQPWELVTRPYATQSTAAYPPRPRVGEEGIPQGGEVPWNLSDQQPVRIDPAVTSDEALQRLYVYASLTGRLDGEWDSTARYITRFTGIIGAEPPGDEQPELTPTAGLRYRHRLPPTSYPDRLAQFGIFQNPDGPVYDGHAMRVTSSTGWRWLGPEVMRRPGLNYHFGVDYVPEGRPSLGAPITAPEGGAVWVYRRLYQDEADRERENPVVLVGSDDGLVLQQYSPDDYGDAVVLVTEPEQPRRGRVYLFFHVDEAEVLPELERRYGTGPTAHGEAVRVDPGQWIGFIGVKGTRAAHVHMEVYEYFDHPALWRLPDPERPWERWDEPHASVDDTRRATRVGRIPEDNLGWQRVDPQTVFNPERVEIVHASRWPFGDGSRRVRESAAGVLRSEWGELGVSPHELAELYFRGWPR